MVRFSLTEWPSTPPSPSPPDPALPDRRGDRTDPGLDGAQQEALDVLNDSLAMAAITAHRANPDDVVSLAVVEAELRDVGRLPSSPARPSSPGPSS